MILKKKKIIINIYIYSIISPLRRLTSSFILFELFCYCFVIIVFHGLSFSSQASYIYTLSLLSFRARLTSLMQDLTFQELVSDMISSLTDSLPPLPLWLVSFWLMYQKSHNCVRFHFKLSFSAPIGFLSTF